MAPRPTPFNLAVGLAVVFTMTMSGLTWTAVEASRTSEDRATSRATTQAFCDILRLYLDPGLPPVTTERGRVQLTQFRTEYARLKCASAPAAHPR